MKDTETRGSTHGLDQRRPYRECFVAADFTYPEHELPFAPPLADDSAHSGEPALLQDQFVARCIVDILTNSSWYCALESNRIAEMIVLNVSLAERGNFASVRWGNVLGSSGSITPIFLRLCRDGSPVKIRHPRDPSLLPDHPEPMQLVLRASAPGNRGKLLVPEIGEPVKIAELAHNQIRQSDL